MRLEFLLCWPCCGYSFLDHTAPVLIVSQELLCCFLKCSMASVFFFPSDFLTCRSSDDAPVIVFVSKMFAVEDSALPKHRKRWTNTLLFDVCYIFIPWNLQDLLKCPAICLTNAFEVFCHKCHNFIFTFKATDSRRNCCSTRASAKKTCWDDGK